MVRHWIAAILSAFLCALAIAAPETTTITGTIYVGGVAATGGTVSATLSQAGVTPDGSSEVAVTGTTTTALSGAGAFSIALVPNDAIRPSATYYDVRITVTGPTSSSWRERWVVATSPDPTTYGAVTKVEVVPGRIVHADYVRYVPTEPTGTCTANETPRIEMATDKWCECVSGTWSCSSMGGGGSSAFNSLTSGTNTTAAMTVGSGATLDVQGGTLRTENLNAVRYMDQLATGGTGVDLTNRWTGWWSSLAANTTHRFPRGYYGVNDGGGGGAITIPAGATLLCDEGAIFSFSAARTTVANMFFISPGSDNITIKGCAFEPGVTVPFDGYPGGTGGGTYLRIGTLGDVNVSSNIAIEGNRFGVFRYDTSPAQGIGGGVQIQFHEVDNLKIHGNTFDASLDCIDNGSANNTAQHTPSNVSIVGNVFNFSQTWEDMGGAIQLGTGLGKVCTGGTNDGTLCSSNANCTGGGTCTGLAAYETIGSGLVVADNVFESVNGVLYLNHRWDGVTVTGNVARSDNLDFFMLPGVCSPLSGICSAASTAVTVTGNSIVTDIIPGNGVVDHTGPNGIKVAATGAVNISDNIILGAGGIEINGYDTAQVPDWAKGPVIVANNIVNHIDKTTTDATSWCVYSTDLSYVQITGNTCVNTGNYGIRNEANSRTPEFVTVRDNLIIDKNVSSIYGSGVSLGSCTKCVVEGNIFRGPIPSGGVVTGATADDMVYGNTADPALSSVIPFIIGPGTNNDIKLRFDQGSTLASGAADPDLVWDDNPGQFEFDFTGALNDGDPKIASTGFIGPVTGNASTASALAANGANCSAGQVAGGVDASGIAESCIDLAATYQPVDANLSTIAGLTCTAGQPLEWGASDWACGTDDTGAGGGDAVSIDGTAATDPDFRSDGDIDTIRCTGAGAPDASCLAVEDVIFRYNAGSIFNADINASAAIAGSKLASEVVLESETVTVTEASPSSGHILIYDGADSYDNKALSGHGTLASTGALRITNKSAECFTLYDVDGLADTNDIPSVWKAPAAVTVTEVWCESDTASGTAVNLQRDDGTAANVLSSNYTCTTTPGTGTIAAAEDNFADGDRLDFVMVTAGAATRINVCVEYTYD